METLDIGQKLGPYELKERVGQGGMAVVYRGVDTALHRPVAVKVLHRHLSESAEARERFEREARAVAKLRHENILEIFAFSGAGSTDNYIVTEFIEGKTLKQFCEGHPIRHPEIAAMIVVELCRALEHAHGLGVLHRDIKPENIMVQTGGAVKLMDFGIAQMIDLERVTVTGQLLGSPAYMAPEHVEGQPLDFRADVFALGVVLYQLSTGSLPFDGKNPHETLKKISDGSYLSPDRKNPFCGRAMCRIITRTLARNRDDRYPEVAALRADLEAMLAEVNLYEPKSELARFFAEPERYEKELSERLIAALGARAQTLCKSQPAAALDCWNRILCLDPNRAEIKAELAAFAARPPLKRLFLVAGATAGLGLLAIGWLFAESGPAPAAIRPAHGPAALPQSVPEAIADSVSTALSEPEPAPQKPAPRPAKPPRVAAAPPPAAPVEPTTRQLAVSVSPQNSEVQIQGGGFERIGGTR